MPIFLRKLAQKPQNLLVARTDRIGDFILTLPVFDVLSQRLNINFSVLCREELIPLLKHNPHVKNIINVSNKRDDLIRKIESANFDCLLVLVNDSLIQQLLSQLGSIPCRIGTWSKPRVFLKYTHPVIQKRSRSLLNEAEYNLAMLKIFGLSKVESVRPQLYFVDDEIHEFKVKLLKMFGIDRLPAHFIIFHQGMAGSALNWSQENYFRLLSSILEAGFWVVLTGSGQGEIQGNRLFFNKLRPKFASRLFDFTNRFSLRDLAQLIKLSTLFIGPSTGPTHLANAVGTRLISFYPPISVQSARRWGPHLAESVIFTPQVPCGQKYKCSGEKCKYYYCMDSISPDHVFGQVEKLISETQMEKHMTGNTL